MKSIFTVLQQFITQRLKKLYLTRKKVTIERHFYSKIKTQRITKLYFTQPTGEQRIPKETE
jgi:hypothetical protein